MGRTGTALTMVTDRDLGNLKRLLKVRGINPEWRGREPDLTNVKARSGGGRRRGGAQGKGKPASGGRRQEHHGPPHHREHHSRARSR